MAQGLYDNLGQPSPLKQDTAGNYGQGLGGLVSIASGIIGGGKRRAEQRDARAEMERNKANYMNLDTSNLAAGMENTYEDLTVNTQAADMATQQSQQNMANIMGGLSGGAGGAGIAGLAQVLQGGANQQVQQASSLIGSQETANDLRSASGAMSIQNAEIAGAQESRGLEADKIATLLGMSQNRLGAANLARQGATGAIMGGIGDLTSSIGQEHLANS